MRKLVVAVLAVLVALALAATTLTLTSPADASATSWHTVLKNRRAKFQACKVPTGYNAYRQQTEYQVYWQVDNRRGRKRAALRAVDTDQGTWVSTAQIPRVPAHARRGPVSYSPEYDTDVTSLSTRYSHHRKYASLLIASIGLC